MVLFTEKHKRGRRFRVILGWEALWTKLIPILEILEIIGPRWKNDPASTGKKLIFVSITSIKNNYMTITWQLHVPFLDAFYVDNFYEEVLCHAH